VAHQAQDEVQCSVGSTHKGVAHIEHYFGVLKLKWGILLDLPNYPMLKQSKIIHACMALHNFI
jgi:hypothetical protein